MGVSALGNVIVMTYTATRVKQEIAKEAILPFPKFFASNHDLSIGRFLKWTIGSNKIASSRWLSAENFQEKTPVGATVLHLITCVVLIFGTWTLPPDQAYLLLVGISSYLMTAFFGILLSVGILYLRLRPSVRWNEKSPRVSSKVSITAAATFLILNLFPVVAKWFKPPVQKIGVLKWYLVPTVSWATLGFGALWWLVIFMRHRIKDRRTNQVLTIEKQPEYVEEPIGSGQLVQTHETTFISRKGKGDAKADLEALGFRSDSAKHEPDARMAQLGFDAGD
jgi:amino acid transporter